MQVKVQQLALAGWGLFFGLGVFPLHADEILSSTEPLVAMTDSAQSNTVFTWTRSAQSASRLPTTVTVLRIDRLVLGNDRTLSEVLERQVSIQRFRRQRVGDNTSVSLRDANPSSTLILLDGRPLAGTSLSPVSIDEIPLSAIDRVEITRGGFSSLYGSGASAGVINIITKRATYAGRPISWFGIDGGEYGELTYRLNFGSQFRALDYFFFADRKRDDGFRDHSSADSYAVGGNLGWSLGRGGKLQFDIGSTQSRADSPGLLYVTPSLFDDKRERIATTPEAEEERKLRYVRASYLLPIGDAATVALRLHDQERETHYDEPTVNDVYRQTQTKGAEVQVGLPFELTLGGVYGFDRLDTDDRLTAANSFVHSRETKAIYGQKIFSLNLVQLIASGRWDRQGDYEIKTPRVEMLGDLLNWLRLSASAGRSFRTPTLEESLDNSATPFGVRLANAGLVPETAWTYDAGLEVHTDSHTVRATVYRSSVRNLIQSLYVTSTTFQSSNVADGERQGIELQIHHVWAKNLESGLRYRYADVQGRPSGFSERVLLAYSPRHIVSHSLLIRPSQKTRIDSNLQFVDKQFSGNAQTGDKLSNRLIWDLRFGVNVLQAEFYIGARNITDRRYVEQPGFPLVGRTLYGGVQLKLWD